MTATVREDPPTRQVPVVNSARPQYGCRMAGELLGSGRSADVYALDEEWVLRRYRDGGDAAEEGRLMAYLAEAGYPVPAVRPGPAAHGELVLQRLPGVSLLAAVAAGDTTPDEAGAAVAALLYRLHAVPARRSADPAHRVIHLDLHPDNVMLTPHGPVVIDWRTAVDGPPGLDWAMSALILAEVAVGQGPFEEGARLGLAALLARRDPAAPPLAAGHLAVARRRRAADPNLSADEVEALDGAAALVAATETAVRAA
ncbi:phosphotransferase [Streptomyces sp. NPDC060194]|uniref:phosphotransferase n=1 Tax=Streptomyces sp. NPDC060194 TaxID=3347069 RepID=UPI00365E9C8E